MREINMQNVLIRAHKESKGVAPLPNDYESFTDFLVAHQRYLISLKEDNKRSCGKIFKLMRKHRGVPGYFAYCSGLLHIRKEYGAYLTRGIDTVERKLNGN